MFLHAGWKLNPVVGAVYGPELYAGKSTHSLADFLPPLCLPRRPPPPLRKNNGFKELSLVLSDDTTSACQRICPQSKIDFYLASRRERSTSRFRYFVWTARRRGWGCVQGKTPSPTPHTVHHFKACQQISAKTDPHATR